jgi:hypothetical protein
MSTDELKLNLIYKIKTIDDTSLLEEIKQLLDFEVTGIYNLNDEQKKNIAEAKNEYATENILTNDDANNEIIKWLKK